MSDEKAKSAVEVIHPPNKLRARVGPGTKGMDPQLLAKAEEAVVKVQNSIDFAAQVAPDLAKIATALQHISKREEQQKHLEAMFQVVHDLRGGGTSFGYPLVTQIGSLLCKYIEHREDADDGEIDVIRAHVDALRAVVLSKLKGDGGAIGQEIVKGLHKIVLSQVPPTE
ncbi:MAG: Hpt domain-containing protein [Proteobacteria bacterium]|nr:Hpt domain-containing protein [Pseudomonadota bacterium]MBI3496521.1 Hpt domain-containing protein [Pseudomonadota bacterium]